MLWLGLEALFTGYQTRLGLSYAYGECTIQYHGLRGLRILRLTG